MKEIKDRIECLIDKYDLADYKIGLFAIDFEFYEVAKILHNNGIFPSALLVPFENHTNMKCHGIRVCSVETFKKQYKKTAILLRTGDYLAHKELLEQNGYIINQNLFVDCEIKNKSLLFKHNSKLFLAKIRQFRFFVINKKNALKKYLHCVYDQCYGYHLYQRIRKTYPSPNTPIYVYDYSGMGDVYVFCLYLNANYAPDSFILTVIGKVSKRITDLFQFRNVMILSKSEAAKLTHFARLMGEKYNLHPITPFPAHLHTDVFSHYLFGKKLNMAEAYKYVMFNISNGGIRYPKIPKRPGEVEQLFASYHLKPGNTVILSPYANTIIGYSPEFWNKLVNRLKASGFLVCTNCSGREPPLVGTKQLPFPLEIAEEVVDYAGYFVGLRSGFCDVICNSIAFKCFLYPDYPIFNSNIYSFCSFTKMKIGQNYKDICWDYEDLELLQNLVLKSLTHARLYKSIK